MISLTLNDSRNFMSHLLLSDTFDHFLLVEGELVTCFTLRVDGFAQKAFFQKDDPELEQLDFQPSNVQGLYLNLRFDGSHLQCITGTSLNLFTPDKSLEHAWDLSVQKFLAKKGISFESDL